MISGGYLPCREVQQQAKYPSLSQIRYDFEKRLTTKKIGIKYFLKLF